MAAAYTTGAALLQKQPDVLAVTPDELVTQDTSSTPSFLGLDASSLNADFHFVPTVPLSSSGARS